MARSITAGHIGTRQIDWKAAAYAGLIAGVVFMMLEMLMVWLFLGQSPWGPPRMIAAMAMGQNVLPPPATFEVGIVMTAMIIHFMLSVIYGFILALIAATMSVRSAALTGAAFGFAIYVVNFYPIAAALFPWFAEARNWVSIFSHVAFGAILGWLYARLRADGNVT